MSNNDDRDSDAISRIDEMDYYGVELWVDEAQLDEGEISVALHKENSNRHINDTRFYRDDSGEWRCILHDNYAVVDKALSVLNENRGVPIVN